MLGAPKGRRDHYLPQGYLRGFIDPARQNKPQPLWKLDIASKRWAERSTRQVGHSRGFYDYVGTNPELDSLPSSDKTFSELENQFPVVREKLLSLKKKKFRNWTKHLRFLLRYMDMLQLVERFKTNRMNTPTKKGTARQPATVNRELNLLSSAFSLAVVYDKAEFNPCSKVDLFPLDNLRYRYLLPEEEPRLMAELSGPRAHLRPAVIVALGTGMRLGEQLRMKRSQVDFLRDIVTARKTKNGRPRDIPMNDEVRETLAELCKDKRPDAYVFVSPEDDAERQREGRRDFPLPADSPVSRG